MYVYSYQERWRDWPCEARQPAFIFKCIGVNSYRVDYTHCKIRKVAVLWNEILLMEAIFLNLRK
jgi:hypothetical protein